MNTKNANNPISSIAKLDNFPQGTFIVHTRGWFIATVSKLTSGLIHIQVSRNDVWNGPESFDSWKEAFACIRAEVAVRRADAVEVGRLNAIRRAREAAKAKRAEAARRAAMTAEERAAEDKGRGDLFAMFFAA